MVEKFFLIIGTKGVLLGLVLEKSLYSGSSGYCGYWDRVHTTKGQKHVCICQAKCKNEILAIFALFVAMLASKEWLQQFSSLQLQNMLH